MVTLKGKAPSRKKIFEEMLLNRKYIPYAPLLTDAEWAKVTEYRGTFRVLYQPSTEDVNGTLVTGRFFPAARIFPTKAVGSPDSPLSHQIYDGHVFIWKERNPQKSRTEGYAVANLHSPATVRASPLVSSVNLVHRKLNPQSNALVIIGGKIQLIDTKELYEFLRGGVEEEGTLADLEKLFNAGEDDGTGIPF